MPKHPVIIACRGQLSPSAIEIHGGRKRSMLRLGRSFGIFRSVIWHATTESEANQIREHFGDAVDVRVAEVISGLTNDPSPPYRRRKVRGQASLVFLSRVSPMKNLAFAIKILGRISSKVTMDVIGPIEDESYWRDCEAAIALLPDHVKINLQGPVPHDEVAEALGRYDMFVLPTLGDELRARHR